MTDTKTAPKKFYRRGVEQAIRRLDSVARESDPGVPNPRYAEACEELSRLRAGLEAWESFVEAASRLGFRENSYSVRIDGAEHEEGTAFVRKDAGRWVGYTRSAVAALVAQEV